MIITNSSWGGQALVVLCKSPSSACFHWRGACRSRLEGVTSRRCSFMKKVHESSRARGTVRAAAERVWTSVRDCRSRTGCALQTRHTAQFVEAGGLSLKKRNHKRRSCVFVLFFFCAQVAVKVWDYPRFSSLGALFTACMN